MTDYPVLWKERGEPAVAGMLEVGTSGVTLVGGGRRNARRVEIAFSEIIGLSRADQRVGDLPALRLERHPVGTFLIAGLSGVALNSEILDELYASLSSLF